MLAEGDRDGFGAVRGALTVTDAALAKIEAAVKKALPTAHGLYKAKLRQENNTLILRVNRQNGLILLLK